MRRNTLLVLITILISGACFGKHIKIAAEEGKYILDDGLGLIVCNSKISEHRDLTNTDSLSLVLSGHSYKFRSIPNSLAYGVSYRVNNNSKEYLLYFSSLPIVNINTSEVIVDEPKVLSTISVADTSAGEVILSNCGIEFRGGFSQYVPKKSFDLELWEGTDAEDTDKYPILGMRNDDDWLLLAMFNEPLRIRNVISHKLWRDIHAPYYAEEEPDAMSGITTRYIELAINNEYMGLYALTEQMDRKQLELKKYKTSLRGELYKGFRWDGAETFSSLPSFNNASLNWSGFEMKYPKDDETTDWTNLYNFVDFVINATAVDFEEEISEKFRMDNAIDYFIYLNLLRATDNTGKNIHIARYTEDEPYFYVPWDLDGTFGMLWDGSRDNITSDILSNGLYDRLLKSDETKFMEEASKRWSELRMDLLKESNLKSRIDDNYNLLAENANYEREVLKWGGGSVDLTNLEYTYQWLNSRIEFLDEYFNLTVADINNFPAGKEHFEVFPNPVETAFRVRASKACQFDYQIYNLKGVLLRKGASVDGQLIDIDYFSSGLYFLKITDDEHQPVGLVKLVKE